jgi:ABC-type antimicrobial peptide transport system permease subunit
LFADVPREIIGVVGDVREFGIDQPSAPIAYLMQAQISDILTDTMAKGRPPQWILRTGGSPLSISDTIRREVHSIDPSVAVANFSSMEFMAGNSILQYRFNMTLMGVFGTVALLLSVIGIYGVLSYQVGRRAREMGIRLALGADSRKLLRLVVGQGMFLTTVGIVIGLAGALALSHVLTALLYGITPRDPVTLIVVGLMLGAAAFLACYIPARRAAKVHPMVALRYE